MFCGGCGNKLEDIAKFCPKCGKPTQLGESIAKQNQIQQKNQMEQLKIMARTSLNHIANSTGYYCFKCGNYVNRQAAINNGTLNCRCCGTSIIGPNYLTYAGRTLLDYGFIGSVIAAGYNYSHYDSPERYILAYYNSAYYNQTHYPFEVVASDKGKMGEYLIDVAYQQLKYTLPNINTYIFYNLQIPEADGKSFQEIDAVIIYGAVCLVIEAKNRSGYFSMSHVSDHDWTLSYPDGSTTRVYNPLMQNQEHIAALDHYLYENCDLGTTSPNYFNLVALSGDGELNWNMQIDPMDTLLLDSFTICKNGSAGNTLIDLIKEFEAVKNSPDYDDFSDRFGPQHANKIADALMPLVRMSEEDKSINMRNREAGHSGIKKYPNTFFYAECTYGFPYLVRSNGVHIMNVPPGKSFFTSGYGSFMIKDGKMALINTNEKTKVVRLDTPKDIYDAFKCVSNCERYNIPERYYNHNKGNNSYSGNNQNSGNQRSSQPENYDEMFFSGCEDMDMLNARYRNLCKTFHPDGTSGDEETFKKIQQAYENKKAKLSA